MSDKPYYHEPNQTVHLRTWALGQMMWGGFLAGVFLLAVAAIVLVIYGIGLLLPEESKQAPSPYAAVEVRMEDPRA